MSCGSKSINMTRFPSPFKPAPMLIAQVVFPTPLFWLIKAIICIDFILLYDLIFSSLGAALK